MSSRLSSSRFPINPRLGGDLPPTRLYVGNLPRGTTKADIEEHFSLHGAGKVKEVKLMTGFGFIEYDDPLDARDAVPAFHGSEFQGQRLTVQYARVPPRKTSFGSMRYTSSQVNDDTGEEDSMNDPVTAADLIRLLRKDPRSKSQTQLFRHFKVVKTKVCYTISEDLTGKDSMKRRRLLAVAGAHRPTMHPSILGNTEAKSVYPDGLQNSLQTDNSAQIWDRVSAQSKTQKSSRQASSASLTQDVHPLSRDDNQIINQRAAQLAKSTSKENIDKSGNPQRFKRQERKKRHRDTVHEKNEHGLYKCWVSGCKTAPFTGVDNLKSHLRNTHGKKSPNQRNRYVATQDKNSVHYDPDWIGELTENGYPILP